MYRLYPKLDSNQDMTQLYTRNAINPRLPAYKEPKLHTVFSMSSEA